MYSTKDLLSLIPLVLIVIILTIIWKWAKDRSQFWKNQNIPHTPALPFVGNLIDLFLYRKSSFDHMLDMYFDPGTKDEPISGYHLLHKPALFLREPELIKRVLVKDFNLFTNRHTSSDIHSDVLGGANLFLARTPFWRHLRQRLSPVFTIGRTKKMFYLMDAVGNQLNKYLLQLKNDDQENGQEESNSTRALLKQMDIKDLCARYTTDVISQCAFGIEANSIFDVNSDFRKYGKKFFDFTLYRAMELSCFFFMPELTPKFGFKFFPRESEEFLRTSMNYIIKEREKSGEKRNDLIDLLIVLKKEDEHKIQNENEPLFKDDILVAQAGLFFTAGFESSSSLIAFALYELSLDQTSQTRLRQEIKKHLIKNDGKLTYEIIMDMEYLEMVVAEILRLYPPSPFLDRLMDLTDVDDKSYTLEPYLNFKIPHGMPMIIPVFALHRDPKYFPNPNKFDPERFSSENKPNIVPYSYLPFGTGSRNCIGEIFGPAQSKVGLISFLRNHMVQPCEKTPRTMRFNKKSFSMASADGIFLNVLRDPLI